MTREEAEVYAQNMSFEDAIYNLSQARCIPYRKATFIKIKELLSIIKDMRAEIENLIEEVRPEEHDGSYESIINEGQEIMGEAILEIIDRYINGEK